jgi:hypothetical protein
VAQYALIDGYLDVMRSEIHWRRDLDDVVSEMEDHLYTSVECLVARGHEPDSAQRTTLDRFGEPTVLAAVYASTPTGGLAVPTQGTQRAGIISIVAGGFWLAAAAVYLLSRINDIQGGDGWQTYYAIFSATILGASLLTGLAMWLGIHKRSGGLGVLGNVGLAVTGLGVAATLVAWAVFLWMPLLAIGLAILGVAALRAGVAPTWPTVLVATGFIIGVIGFVSLNALELGPADSFGDYPLAWGISTTLGMGFVAAGLLGWGSWLRSEEPTDITPAATAA